MVPHQFISQRRATLDHQHGRLEGLGADRISVRVFSGAELDSKSCRSSGQQSAWRGSRTCCQHETQPGNQVEDRVGLNSAEAVTLHRDCNRNIPQVDVVMLLCDEVGDLGFVSGDSH